MEAERYERKKRRIDHHKKSASHHQHKKRRQEKDRFYDEPDLGFVPDHKSLRHFPRQLRSMDECAESKEVILFQKNELKKSRTRRHNSNVKIIIVWPRLSSEEKFEDV